MRKVETRPTIASIFFIAKTPKINCKKNKEIAASLVILVALVDTFF
jgi:hypothetical protein